MYIRWLPLTAIGIAAVASVSARPQPVDSDTPHATTLYRRQGFAVLELLEEVAVHVGVEESLKKGIEKVRELTGHEKKNEGKSEEKSEGEDADVDNEHVKVPKGE
ncbi:hypothetical protein BJ085DRAFT_27967 [Dimargaris cristalligena]|uniref:Uncharacterized protein n=1 Tax=Dimargaris cristalligena TaxID=215637 RepID=A0A4P9ZZN7_9FUNG|nr:hypothetical protein BJ085DRAFT_27967 [Dimargaris cristalligena]|eukprot:RKP38591.1 hypothetical protein BJ085DRAFT_27967 [Dimargaris cristalligena]